VNRVLSAAITIEDTAGWIVQVGLGALIAIVFWSVVWHIANREEDDR